MLCYSLGLELPEDSPTMDDNEDEDAAEASPKIVLLRKKLAVGSHLKSHQDQAKKVTRVRFKKSPMSGLRKAG